MSIIQSLDRAGERLEAQGTLPAAGYSLQKVSFVISLQEDGSVACVDDLRVPSGKKRLPRELAVPQPVKRSSGISSNFFCDKTSYVLGVSAAENKRLEQEHEAFRQLHLVALAGADDIGLLAFKRFLENWTADQFQPPLWPEEMKDQNVIFTLESDRLKNLWLHQRPAAKALWQAISTAKQGASAVCLATGQKTSIARLHPAIKGVWGAQSSGASLVSFNLDAFTSYGHEQGSNAPISETVADRYTAVLNLFLQRDSGHSIQIGDASTVFWAEDKNGTLDENSLKLAEGTFSAFLGDAEIEAVDEHKQAQQVGHILAALKKGQRLESLHPDLAKGVRFYILGLAPNNARLAVRFYFEDDFGVLANTYGRFLADTNISPAPQQPPTLWRYLLEVAVLGKRENVPPNLAGELMSAILTGASYPRTLLANILMRIRSGGAVNSLRVALLRATLVRNFNLEKEAPVAFDPDNTNRGYLLGRLFANYENIQYAALRKVNASIKDKYFAAASTQPRKVFGLLASGSTSHISKLSKQNPGYAINLEKGLAAIFDKMSPEDDPFPVSLAPQEQALFALGYYHQRSEFFKSTKQNNSDQEEVSL
jgi:CRISPR-associated protein Csd1